MRILWVTGPFCVQCIENGPVCPNYHCHQSQCETNSQRKYPLSRNSNSKKSTTLSNGYSQTISYELHRNSSLKNPTFMNLTLAFIWQLNFAPAPMTFSCLSNRSIGGTPDVLTGGGRVRLGHPDSPFVPFVLHRRGYRSHRTLAPCETENRVDSIARLPR